MIDASLRGPFYGRSFADIQSDIEARGPVAIAAETLDAIERINPKLNAFVYVNPTSVLNQARELEARPERGPLYGVPIGIKDLVDVEGWPVTCGSGLFASRIAQSDALVVRRLREAGALIAGMTTTHEFAYGPTADITATGPVHNPHDLSRMTGGSSGGSGAAVAAGLVPIALGTDTGGSIRVPAALCGTVGLKPTFGGVPLTGVYPLAKSLDHLGPLANSVAAAAAAYAVLADTDLDSNAEPQWIRLTTDRVPHVDKRVSQLVADTLELTEELSLGNWPQMRQCANALMAREAYDVHVDQLDARKDEYQPEVWERIDGGRATSDEDYARLLAERDQMRSALLAVLTDTDLLVTPTVGITAPEIGERESFVDDIDGATRAIVTNLTVRWNLMGFPALSVPIGEIGGLPVGMQLIGRPGTEPMLLRAAAQIEAKVASR